jgi:hypothetical protein
MRHGRWLFLALLLAPASSAAPVMPKQRLNSSADLASCYGLAQSGGLLRAAFAKGSAFPDQVYGAFAGQGSGDATAGDYMTRGQDLLQLADAVAAQCRAAFGPGTAPAEPVVAAPIRRRVQSARRTVDLYLDLPRTIAKIDDEQSPAGLALRGEFLAAMYKIADGGDYEAASALADDAHAKLARNR